MMMVMLVVVQDGEEPVRFGIEKIEVEEGKVSAANGNKVGEGRDEAERKGK